MFAVFDGLASTKWMRDGRMASGCGVRRLCWDKWVDRRECDGNGGESRYAFSQPSFRLADFSLLSAISTMGCTAVLI